MSERAESSRRSVAYLVDDAAGHGSAFYEGDAKLANSAAEKGGTGGGEEQIHLLSLSGLGARVTNKQGDECEEVRR
eukprot:755727-Hanusia_phi.AAC.1